MAQVFENLNDVMLPANKPVVLTIGTFDGVHCAHQALLRETIEEARRQNGIAAVLTFQNHPRTVIAPGHEPMLLTNWPAKRDLILAQGIDVLVGIPFDESLLQMPAEQFVSDVIGKKFGARAVMSGPAFHFGFRGAGNSELLQKLSDKHAYVYKRQDPISLHGCRVSSTLIRDMLDRGDVAGAAELLTRPHRNVGTVVTGDGIGRTIQFPTANMQLAQDVLIPPRGVYAVRVTDGASTYPAMMNIGWRPTVGGKELRNEIHLLDFDGDLVGRRMTIDYVKRLRDEKKFDGLDALREQLQQDRVAARAALTSP
ncbi:bifunctional riboflavin kinase/FAD synthetase [Candidatus Sumerlaeota bacterium]|nr:bifunctional riboflavin kinase/FAD synthetase [Candidatus Sumerlaeota bacterium]